MALKTLTASFSRALVVALTAVAALCLATSADAAPKKKRVTSGPSRVYSGPTEYSYMSGPRTRVYITRRSWLDPGTEVLPGERKFTDYAIAPGYSYGRNIDRNNYGRHPLGENWDLGGYPTGFPLY